MIPRIPLALALAAAALVAAVLGLPAPAYPHKPITTNILFKNEVAQIFQRKCFQCHTADNLGMALTTYTDARPWARAIREEILDRRMPPWTAVPGFGHFANDISLSVRETEIILSWTDGGAPSGVLKVEESIPPVYVPPAPEWALGEPDQVVKVSPGHRVEAGAAITATRFVVASGLRAPRRLRALALKQGDRRVVRYAAFYERASGRWLGSWTPWQTAATLPDGAAHRLPAGAEIVVEVGYAGTDEPVTDASELGLYWAAATGPTADAVRLRAPDVPLAGGTAGHRVRAEVTLKAPAAVTALWPDPGAGARSIEITAVGPDGVATPLLWIKDYRPEWRSPYILSDAAPLVRGTRVLLTAYFDNPSPAATLARADAWLSIINR